MCVSLYLSLFLYHNHHHINIIIIVVATTNTTTTTNSNNNHRSITNNIICINIISYLFFPVIVTVPINCNVLLLYIFFMTSNQCHFALIVIFFFLQLIPSIFLHCFLIWSTAAIPLYTSTEGDLILNMPARTSNLLHLHASIMDPS